MIFQSPFSGDFLCFGAEGVTREGKEGLSISIFRRFSLFLYNNDPAEVVGFFAFNLHFQEIFFVSLHSRYLVVNNDNSFNLHFQEIFFVSSRFVNSV